MLKYNMNKQFNKVLITDIHDRTTRYECDNIDGYKKHLKSNPDMVEHIGEYNQQIKPIFDIDAYDTKPDINSIIIDINKLFPNKTVKYAEREPREYKGKLKFSYRFYVLDVRIKSKNLKQLIKDNGLDKNSIYDLSIYDKNKVLFLPLTTKKADNNNVPALIPIDCDIFDCCASYIKEDYEDWDLKIPVFEEQKIIYKKIIDEDDEKFDDKEKYNYDFILDIINHISVKRADNYDMWIEVCFCIIGACVRSKISKTSCSKLIHHFSQLSKDKYDEFKVDEWIDINYKRCIEAEKSYGYKQLIHTYLKEDSFEYYDEKFNKSYDKIKTEFEKYIIKILDDNLYIEINHDRDIHKPEVFYIKKQSQLIHKYEDDDRFIYMKTMLDKKGNKINCKINITDTLYSDWWKDPNKRKVDRCIFQPFKLDEKLEKKYYNMFQGLRIQHLPINKDYPRINRILDHIKIVICNNDEYSYNWFLKYLCAILNGRRTNVMIMIRGQEGCGKNILLNMIAYGLIGDDYAIATSSPEKQFFGNFNSLLQNRIFTLINEGQHGLRNCMDNIKDLITEDRINIEKKGIDAISLKNYNNFIGDTNNWNILNISSNDRRFVFFNCNNEYAGNEDYFIPLVNDLKDDAVLSAFYHYLINEIKCVEDFDFQKTRPITSLYKKLQKVNLPNPITYLLHIKDKFKYRKYKEEIYTTEKCADMYENYKDWCLKYKYEIFKFDSFENKLIDDVKCGIEKCIDRKKYKVYKINKNLFETFIKKYENLEDLKQIEDDYNSDCDFIEE